MRDIDNVAAVYRQAALFFDHVRLVAKRADSPHQPQRQDFRHYFKPFYFLIEASQIPILLQHHP